MKITLTFEGDSDEFLDVVEKLGIKNLVIGNPVQAALSAPTPPKRGLWECTCPWACFCPTCPNRYIPK